MKIYEFGFRSGKRASDPSGLRTKTMPFFSGDPAGCGGGAREQERRAEPEQGPGEEDEEPGGRAGAGPGGHLGG